MGVSWQNWRLLDFSSQASATFRKGSFTFQDGMGKRKKKWQGPTQTIGKDPFRPFGSIQGSKPSSTQWLRVSEVGDYFRKSGVEIPLHNGLQLTLKWKHPSEWAKGQGRKCCEHSLVHSSWGTPARDIVAPELFSCWGAPLLAVFCLLILPTQRGRK